MSTRLKTVVRETRNLVKGFRLRSAEAEALLFDVANELWYRLDTPTSLGLSLCLKYGDLPSVLKHEIQPSDYLDAESFRSDYQAVSFLKKCPFAAVPLKERTAAALEKFFEAEGMCRATNRRFANRYASGLTAINTSGNPDVESVLHRAQRKIATWIGEGPNPRVWLECCRFGPGSDDQTEGHRVGSYHKLFPLSATADFADGALSMVLDHPVWAFAAAGLSTDAEEGTRGEIKMLIKPGNTVVFVPKNALIERSIGVEPRMNVFAQLGLGTMLRDMLRTRAHLDLNSQVQNQDLAYDGSRFGHLATIDLSMASDTLAIGLVRDLLPQGWYTALDWVRSRQGVLPDGELITYQKFSSMGNGYTFELESMIFYALAQACCDTLGLCNYYTRAYGDDIICPVEAVALLEEVLTYCGFRVNRRKSFSSGVFRESCGADFFDGTNVRPHFCKEVPTDVKTLYNLANGICRASFSSNRGFGRDKRFRPAWLHTVRRIPKPLRGILHAPIVKERLWGPTIETGDGGLIVDFDEALSSPFVRFAREWQEGFYFGTLVEMPWYERGVTNPNVLLVYALYRSKDGLPPDSKAGVISGRGSVGVRLNSRAYVREPWNIGPWT